MTSDARPDGRLTYAGAGVDIDAGNALVERIKPAVRATARPGSAGGIGGFGALFDLRAAGYADPILVAATDGVGTKLRIGIETGALSGLGQDLVAMCVNDLVCQGAEPLLFLDYFATGSLDVDAAASVIEGIAAACQLAGCVLAGGETAEMPGLYAAGDFDLAGFALGAMERGSGLPTGVAEGDVLLGLSSEGVHSNGFSLVRAVVARAGLGWGDPSPFGAGTLGQDLLTPTRIYAPAVLAAIRSGGVHAAAHITGGGLSENVPRVLPAGLACAIDLSAWALPPVFGWLREEARLSDAELLRTFNAGIGMVLIVAPDRAEALGAALMEAGERVVPLGRVEAAPEGGRPGVRYHGALE